MIGTLAAIGRDEIADYVSALFLVYLILIFARVLMSWIPRMPYNVYLRAVVSFIEQTVDPYLNLFRRILPPLGMFDFSPIIAILLLIVAQGVVVGLIRG
jgi:YggT family protein